MRDGPYDAISSIGMFEHVGLSQLETYFDGLLRLLRPEGRLLNHGISRAPGYRGRPRPWARGFIDSYVFPDGELHEVGSVVSTIKEQGFEVRHVESLREHYPLTLRAWLANLESNWTEVVALVGEARACVEALRGRERGTLRRQCRAGAPGACGEARRRRERHAATPRLYSTVTSKLAVFAGGTPPSNDRAYASSSVLLPFL